MKKFYILSIMMLISSLLLAQTALHNNGPLITNPGAGTSGADLSVLQIVSGDTNTSLGSGNAQSTFYRVADDFTVPTNTNWTIDSIVFFGYQTNSTTSTSTFTAYNIRIWNGVPDSAGSTIVWGDTTTNRLTSSYWSGIYRVSSTTLTGTTRPIMRNVCTTPTLTLTTGVNYWIDWQAAGTLTSGPWQPPITIVGQLETGNAKQRNPLKVWNNVLDGTSLKEQGFPFIIYGTATPIVGINETIINDNFSIYPNPVKNELNITSVTTLKNVKIINAIGQEIMNENVIGNHYKVNTSSYNKGVYFVQIESEKGKTTKKFVVNE